MATKNSPLTYNGKMVSLFLVSFDPILFILANNEDMHNTLDEFEFGKIGPLTTELTGLERLKNFLQTYNGKMVSPC